MSGKLEAQIIFSKEKGKISPSSGDFWLLAAASLRKKHSSVIWSLLKLKVWPLRAMNGVFISLWKSYIPKYHHCGNRDGENLDIIGILQNPLARRAHSGARIPWIPEGQLQCTRHSCLIYPIYQIRPIWGTKNSKVQPQLRFNGTTKTNKKLITKHHCVGKPDVPLGPYSNNFR